MEEEAKAQIEGIGTDYGESELLAFSGEEPEHEKVADVLAREGQYQAEISSAEQCVDGKEHQDANNSAQDDEEEVDERPGPGHVPGA